MKNLIFPLIIGLAIGLALTWVFKIFWLFLVVTAVVWLGFQAFRLLNKP